MNKYKSLFAATLVLASLNAGGDPVAAPVVKKAEQQRDLAHRTIGKLIQNADVSASLNIDATILKGVDAGFRYSYEVQPSYEAGLYTRIDRWNPHLRIKIPKVLTTIDHGGEVIFLRQFTSEAQALKAIPRYDIHKIPLNSENALGLNPGDVVMIPVHLDLLFGPNGDITPGAVGLYGHAGYVMRGSYQIQALRLADNRVRLRLIATRQSGLDGELGLNVRLDVFGVNILDKAFQGVFGTHIGSIGFSNGSRGVVMADYIFDLSNADARDAYDHLLGSDRVMKNFKLVDPLTRREKIQDIFVADLATVDQIASADLSKPITERRITQIFKGHTTGKFESRSIGGTFFHIVTGRFSRSSSDDQKITFIDSDNNQQSFLTPVNQRYSKFGLLFGLRDEEFSRKASMVMPLATEQSPPKAMGEFVVALEIKDKRMGAGETEKVLENLKRNISPVVIDQLNIAPLLTSTSYSNARVYAQVIFNERAMASFQGLTKPQLSEAFEKHLIEVGRRVGEKDPEGWVSNHHFDIWRLCDQMATAFDTRYSVASRIPIFMDLQKDGFFRAVGTGFLMSLLPQDPNVLKTLLSVDMRIDASVFKTSVEPSFGTSEYRGVVKVSEFIQNLLDKGAFDLRLETFGTVKAADGQVISLSKIGQLAPPAPGAR